MKNIKLEGLDGLIQKKQFRNKTIFFILVALKLYGGSIVKTYQNEDLFFIPHINVDKRIVYDNLTQKFTLKNRNLIYENDDCLQIKYDKNYDGYTIFSKSNLLCVCDPNFDNNIAVTTCTINNEKLNNKKSSIWKIVQNDVGFNIYVDRETDDKWENLEKYCLTANDPVAFSISELSLEICDSNRDEMKFFIFRKKIDY
ncbi:hypothetical protein EDEG_03232 [Edhazardia aedis USNM 41457]|uniref:Uncharacterized protein n=1 Tax=Edhazardia aedis (strain USNM 41457) TaxID=1003232 RepID=J9DI77_EDHAE|nr:hypothetical protein EDEG_03232 [Edhazardia aedis USNM 41457]|eukprot:EJW02330.1 hypothetical protein EDEG_03232 [Edhazardia aedis USNM 41457]